MEQPWINESPQTRIDPEQVVLPMSQEEALETLRRVAAPYIDTHREWVAGCTADLDD
jgi:hypothetical protein